MWTSLDWLIARPYAHRGLHDAELGIIENTAGAVRAAIAAQPYSENGPHRHTGTNASE